MAPDRHRHHGAADQLPRAAAGVVEPARRAARRRRHERHHPESHRRGPRRPVVLAARARARHLRQRLRAIRWRSGAARRRRTAPGVNDGDDWALNDEAIAQPRLRADEEDARRRDGRSSSGCTASGRDSTTTSARRRAAARRSPSRSATRPTTTASSPTCPIVSFSSLMLAPELIRIHEKPAGQLGDAGQGQRHPRRVHAPVRRPRRPGRRHHQQLHGVPRRSST